MPYVSAAEALNLPSLDLDALRREMGPPPWRRALVGTPRTRWAAICWAPGFVSVPHHHPHAEEVFYIVSGQARFLFAGEAGEQHAGPGTLLLAPRGVEHTIAVAGDVPLLFLCSVTPNEDLPDETVERR